jgi:23S rRNA-/tRNA-specific pseudouridylate synthase
MEADNKSKVWTKRDPARVAETLQELWPETFPSASSAKKTLSKRRSPILVNGERPIRCQLVSPGDTVTLLATKALVVREDGETSQETIVASMGPLVLAYLDPALAVVVKPHGMEVISKSKGSLYQQVLFCLPPTFAAEPLRRPCPCHRIDKPTYGLLAVARTKEAARTIGVAFDQRQVHKRYRAIVHGKFIFGGGSAAGSTTTSGGGHIKTDLSGKECHSEWRVVGQSWQVGSSGGDTTGLWLTCLDLFPHTGRQHQLRRHMKSIGHSIVGDDKYGHECSDRELLQLLEACDDYDMVAPLSLMLAAVEIQFPHKDTTTGERDCGKGCVMDTSGTASFDGELLKVTVNMPTTMTKLITIR